MIASGWFALYVAGIVAANVMTARLGLVPVGFGLMVTAGTFAAGLVLLVRDFLHRAGGVRVVLVGIAVGAVLSWVMAGPALAVASCVAFTAAELADLLVFTRARPRGFIPAAGLSNLASAPVDTVLFLWLAGFPLTWPVIVGQLVAKLVWATLVPLALLGGARAVHDQPVHAEHP